MPRYHSIHAGTRQARRLLCLVFTSGALGLLGACGTMKDIPPGTAMAEVQGRYGAPTVECPLPDGTRRAVWSTAPMGQYAWATTITADGRVGQVEQILTDAAFEQVRSGTWDRQRLQCTFGPPAEVSVVGLPSSRHLIWSYRYRQAGAWNSLMHVYLSKDGLVTRVHPGPDPLFEPREFPMQ